MFARIRLPSLWQTSSSHVKESTRVLYTRTYRGRKLFSGIGRDFTISREKGNIPRGRSSRRDTRNLETLRIDLVNRYIVKIGTYFLVTSGQEKASTFRCFARLLRLGRFYDTCVYIFYENRAT